MVLAVPASDAVPMFRLPDIEPQTDLERRLLADDELRAGLMWGRPRLGHPEGRVQAHVASMLAMIDPDDPMRAHLRLLALIHDSFKRRVRSTEPRSKEN